MHLCVSCTISRVCFFATTYHLYIMQSDYLISGFVAGNNYLDILAMTFNFILVAYSPFIFMLPHMNLTLYAITCIIFMLIHPKNILYIHVHIFI